MYDLLANFNDIQRFSDLNFRNQMKDAEKNLNRIKREIKKLLDTERIKLE